MAASQRPAAEFYSTGLFATEASTHGSIRPELVLPPPLFIASTPAPVIVTTPAPESSVGRVDRVRTQDEEDLHAHYGRVSESDAGGFADAYRAMYAMGAMCSSVGFAVFVIIVSSW